MLLKHHIKYTKEVLNGLDNSVLDGLGDKYFIKKQIKIGSIANDCCEFANEIDGIKDNFFESVYNLINVRPTYFGVNGFYQSHFGELASMHAMATKENGKSADITSGEVASWFEFLNDVALGKKLEPEEPIKTYLPIFGEVGVECHKIFDSSNSLEIQYRAIGMMFHIIQDSYTPSHCERNVDGEVVKFCYFNYRSPSYITRHLSEDDVKDNFVYESILLNECKICLESILGGKKYNYIPVIKLGDNVKSAVLGEKKRSYPLSHNAQLADLIATEAMGRARIIPASYNVKTADLNITTFLNVPMNDHGSFSGNPKTEWLVDENGNDRDMSLIEEFCYVDPNGKKWTAPKGSIINGASIPQPLWSIVGSPYTGDYRRASIVHDVACNDPTVQRKDADIMFYHACLAGGCSFLEAELLYAGVRIGAWVKETFVAESFAKEKTLFRIPFRPTSDEQFLQSKFQEIATELTALDDKASIAEFDVVINKNIKL